MGRRADKQYAGAAGKVLSLSDVKQLDSGYVLQPKKDGIYSLVSTDRAGRISAIVTRRGEVLGPKLMAEFRGVRWYPDSVIIAETELWTDRANRAAAARGYRQIFPFDALRIGGQDLSGESYRVRRDALMRAEAEVESRGDDRWWIDDADGNAHDPKSGRFVKPIPFGWRRVRVVPQLPVSQADRAWSEWVASDDSEGLVAVALDAKIGQRKSKLKIKESSTLDMVVVSVSDRAMTAFWAAGQRYVALSRPRSAAGIEPGTVIEVRHEGFYDDGAPRFARFGRVRWDLGRMAA